MDKEKVKLKVCRCNQNPIIAVYELYIAILFAIAFITCLHKNIFIHYLKGMVDELTEKRTVLLSKNQQLESLNDDGGSGLEEEEKEEEMDGRDEQKTELLEDIMALNDEIDEMDETVKGHRKNIQKLS